MVQLVINGTTYPETSADKYQVWIEDLGQMMRMAAWNLVFEKRGQIYKISYSYDYFTPFLLNKCLSDLRAGNEVEVGFLLPDGSSSSGLFRCTKFPQPTFAFSKGFGDDARGYWHGISFELEGVEIIAANNSEV